jgi:adenosine deaminase
VPDVERPHRSGAGYAAHSLRPLFDAGAWATVNSDAPTFFGATLLDEIALCVSELGFSTCELAVMAECAAAAAFLDIPASDRKAETSSTALATAWAFCLAKEIGEVDLAA